MGPKFVMLKPGLNSASLPPPALIHTGRVMQRVTSCNVMESTVISWGVYTHTQRAAAAEATKENLNFSCCVLLTRSM